MFKGRNCSLVIPNTATNSIDCIEIFRDNVDPILTSVLTDHEIVKAMITFIDEVNVDIDI